MAARENQGYLVAVIILVILLLCLGLSTFLADAGRRQSAESLKTAQDKLAASEAVLESYRAKSNVLEALVGDFGPSVAEAVALHTTFDYGARQDVMLPENTPTMPEAQIKEIADMVNGTGYYQHTWDLVKRTGKQCFDGKRVWPRPMT